MGQRLRLKSSFIIPGNWTKEEKAVLLALKKYGAIVADNGNFFSVSVCLDDRFTATAFDNLATIDISNFEVVQTTGANEGPRSLGAPTANAGPNQNVTGTSATLSGSVIAPNGSAAVQWRLYSGSAAVNIANSYTMSTTVTFSQAGSSTFLLSGDDSVHAVAYDAVVINVQSRPTLTPAPTPTATPTPTPTPSATPILSVSVSPPEIAEGNDATFTVLRQSE